MQKIQSKLGISWIVLGATGLEGLRYLARVDGIDGKEHKEVIFLQCVDDRALGQFQCNGNGAAEALVQRLRPLIDARNLAAMQSNSR